MYDIKALTSQIEEFVSNLARRGVTFDVDYFQKLLELRRKLQQKTESLQAKRNQLSKQIGQFMRANAQASADEMRAIEQMQAEAKQLHTQLEEGKLEMQQAQHDVLAFVEQLPNQLDESVPDGVDEGDNLFIRQHGELPNIASPVDHVALAQAVEGIDIEGAIRIAGARFALLKNDIARLHRALANFMLDQHLDRGYREYTVPQLVQQQCLYGTGQLPKFKDDIFFTQDKQHALIPTSEVVLANITREQILPLSDVPCKYATLSSCFRKEAGSYGKDTHGLIRQHQFDKVELVQLVAVQQGLQALESITQDAEHILQTLGLPYRVVLLCAGDTGFSAKKTFDLEVWVPSQGQYREISSCSWCGDFQARRMKARYRDADGQIQYLETLNGSGVAVGRALLAVLENYQQANGSVVIPPVIRSYFGGRTHFSPPS